VDGKELTDSRRADNGNRSFGTEPAPHLTGIVSQTNIHREQAGRSLPVLAALEAASNQSISHPSDAGHLFHIVNSDDVGPSINSDCDRRGRSCQSFLGRKVQSVTDERLAAGANQYGKSHIFQAI
jgi:hypothetical protein